MKTSWWPLVLLLAAVPAEAQLNGQVAIEMWPADGRFSNDVATLPDCTAHLVPTADLDAELSFPCGELFAPPQGRYLHWVEGLNRISPDHLVLNYAGGPFQGRSLSIVRATVPAGQVRFTDLPDSPDLVVRLLHLDSHIAGDRLFYELFRRLPAARAAEATRLPAGRAVAFLYDNGKKEYHALGRPFEVKAEAEIRVAAPAPPAQTAVLAIFERPEDIETRGDDDLAPILVAGERRLEPDLRFGDAARVYAVWYDVAGANARLELSAQRWRIDETTISLRQGKVETLRPQLRPKPQLKVELQRPAAWLQSEAKFLLVTPGASNQKPLAEKILPPAESAAVFPAIPPQPLEVELRVGPFSQRLGVDAADGLDHELLFQPEPIELHGQVFVGDTPYPGAEITFHLNRLQALPEARKDQLTVKTDAEGRYQATLFAPGHFPIRVVLPDRRSLPFQIFPRSYIAESGLLDFHLPDNRFTVKVVDRETGRGIPGADVEIESSFGEELSSVISTGDHTGENGQLDLPPIHQGRLQLRVRAAHYEEASRTLDVAARDPGGTPIRIELAPLPEADEILLELADGRPAQGAEAALFSSATDNSLPSWQGRADDEGRLELPPERPGSLLLIRHPAAGAIAIAVATLAERLRLPVRAPDLQVVVYDRAGVPAPTTALAFRLGGVEIAGRALSFLLGNPLPATDRSGVFRAAGLPAARLEVLAWADALQGMALAGALGNLATAFDPVAAQGTFELTRIE